MTCSKEQRCQPTTRGFAKFGGKVTTQTVVGTKALYKIKM